MIDMGKIKRSIPELSVADIFRFLKKIKYTDDHWLWLGYRNSNGYGFFKINGKNHYAHRVAYLIIKSEQPPTFDDLDHVCKNRLCINPDHLEVVSHSINCKRGNQGKQHTHCKRGHELIGYNRQITKAGTRENGTVKIACRICRLENWRKNYGKRRVYS